MSVPPGYLSNAELAAGVQQQTEEIKQFKDEQTNLYTTEDPTAIVTNAEGVPVEVPSWKKVAEANANADAALAAVAGIHDEVESLSDDVDAIRDGQAAGQLAYRTWAELAAVTGTSGNGAQVIDDAGTHTDPVVGGTVSNAGQYVWSESPAGWRWVRPDGLALKADASYVDQLAARPGPGLTDLFAHPNVFRDVEFDNWSAANNAGSEASDGSGYYQKLSSASLSKSVAPDGRPALRYITSSATPGNNATRWRVPLAALGVSAGDYIAASLRLQVGTVGTGLRVMLRQTDGSSEITGARQLVTVPAGAVNNQLVRLGPAPVDPGATHIDIYFDSFGSGTDVTISDVMLARGRVTDYRPPIVGVLTPDELPASVQAITAANAIEAVVSPNLIALSTFTMSDPAPVVGVKDVVSDTVNGERGWKLTWPGSGSEKAIEFGPFTAAQFASGVVSAAVGVLKVEAAAAGSMRVMLRQFDSAGAEITAARQTVNASTGGAAVDNEVVVSFDSVALSPSAATVRLYVAVIGSSTEGAPRSVWFRNPTVYSGAYKGVRVPLQAGGASAARVMYVSPSGNDASAGGEGSPKASLDAAINALGGDGRIYMLGGTYTGNNARVTRTNVKGRIEIVGVRPSISSGDYDFPLVNLGTKVTGISKTSGRTKVYQATVAGLPTLASFNWAYQHGTPEAESEIVDHRQPQHRGRTHRLPWFTRIHKTDATTLSTALDEIDASSTPKAFIDGTTFYFSVVGGGDASSADVYLDSAISFVQPTGAVRGSAGELIVRGLRVFHGAMNLTAFRYAELDEVVVAGARANCVDYNVLRYGTLEVCCSGSASAELGDGLNGHSGAVLFGNGDLYAHDCRDDGFSDHEGCTTRMPGGGLVEYNGGGGITPAYGADTVVHNMVSVRNQRIPGRKHGAFYVTGAPSSGGPPESGVDTRALFIGCVDHESDTSFADDYTRSGTTPAYAVCIGCKSIKPSTRAFNVSEIIDCGFDSGGGSATAKNATTVVKNTVLVT